MAGVPAKRIGWVCKCGEVLREKLHCLACGLEYSEHAGKLNIVD